MQKVVIWFCLMAKAYMHNLILYILSASMIILCLLISGLRFDTGNRVGVYVSGAYNSDLIEERLVNQNEYIMYDDSEAIVEDVAGGSISCGFIINRKYDECILGNKKEKPVKIVISTGYLYAEVEKEKVVSAMLYALSDKIIENEIDNTFVDKDCDLFETIVEKKNEYLRSDVLFGADIEYIDLKKDTSSVNLFSFDIFRFVLFLILAGIMLTGLDRYSKSGQSLTETFGRYDRLIYLFICQLSKGIILGIAGVVALWVSGNEVTIIILISIILTVVYSSLWSTILIYLIRKETTYTALCPAILVASFIVCSVVINLSYFYEPVKYIRWIFPIVYFS